VQEIINIGITGDDATQKKARVQEAAAENRMSISRFMFWLFEQYELRQQRKKGRKTNGSRTR
jgi:hypothetical protein